MTRDRDRDADEPRDWLAAKFHSSDAGATRSEPEEEPATASAFRWGLTPSVLEADADLEDADQVDAHEPHAVEPDAHEPHAVGPDAHETGIDGEGSSEGDSRITAVVAPDTTDSDDLDIDDVESDATPATSRSIFAPRSARGADGQGDAALGSAPSSAFGPIDPGEDSAAVPLDVTARPFYPPPPAISRNIALPRPVSAPRSETSAPVDSATTGGRDADGQTADGRAADDSTADAATNLDDTSPMTMDEVLDAPSPRRAAREAAAREALAREAAAREAVVREAAVRDASPSAPAASGGMSGDGIPAADQTRAASVDAEPAAEPADGPAAEPADSTSAEPSERPTSFFGSSSPVPLVEPTLAPMNGTAEIDALLGNAAVAGRVSSPVDDDEPAPGPRRRGHGVPAAPDLPFENPDADDREFVQPATRVGQPSMSTLQKTLLGVGLVLIVVLLIVLVIVIVQRAGATGATGALPSEATTVAALAGYVGSLRG